MPVSRRVAYVGIDNRAAGATAAYLITRTSGPDPGSVLMTLCSSTFRGEEEREIGFRQAMAELAPGRGLVEVTETDGLHRSMLAAVAAAPWPRTPSIDARLLHRWRQHRHPGGLPRGRPDRRRASWPTTWTATTVTLLRRRQLTAVLHHDLRSDMRAAARLILQAHGALPGPAVVAALADPGDHAVQRARALTAGAGTAGRRPASKD